MCSAVSAEECAAASEGLSGQAEQMRQMLQRFTLKKAAGHNVSSAPKSHPQVPQVPQGFGWSQMKSTGNARPPAVNITLDDEEFGKY